MHPLSLELDGEGATYDALLPPAIHKVLNHDPVFH